MNIMRNVFWINVLKSALAVRRLISLNQFKHLPRQQKLGDVGTPGVTVALFIRTWLFTGQAKPLYTSGCCKTRLVKIFDRFRCLGKYLLNNFQQFFEMLHLLHSPDAADLRFVPDPVGLVACTVEAPTSRRHRCRKGFLKPNRLCCYPCMTPRLCYRW